MPSVLTVLSIIKNYYLKSFGNQTEKITLDNINKTNNFSSGIFKNLNYYNQLPHIFTNIHSIISNYNKSTGSKVAEIQRNFFYEIFSLLRGSFENFANLTITSVSNYNQTNQTNLDKNFDILKAKLNNDIQKNVRNFNESINIFSQNLTRNMSTQRSEFGDRSTNSFFDTMNFFNEYTQTIYKKISMVTNETQIPWLINTINEQSQRFSIELQENRDSKNKSQEWVLAVIAAIALALLAVLGLRKYRGCLNCKKKGSNEEQICYDKLSVTGSEDSIFMQGKSS